MDKEDEDISSVLLPCSICSRTFQPDALTRHERICKKTSEKKRKIFNSSKQRTEGSDIVMQPASSKMVEKSLKKSNWREKHEELIRNIRAAKGETIETREESTPPKKNVPSDYIQCPSCERHFNKKAAERHITWCQSQKAHMPKRSTTNEAKERLQARTKYKAPTPGKKGKEEAQNRKSAKLSEKLREKTTKPMERSSPENSDIRKKSGKKDITNNNMKSEKSNIEKSSYDRDVRSRENFGSQGNGSQQQTAKFKEKFSSPNNKHMNGDVTNDDEYNLIQRIVDLNSSIQANTNMYGDLNSSWNKKMFPPNHNLPEVSSCDEPIQTWPSRSCWGSSSNTPMNSGSNIRTSTSGGREGSSENVMPLFCCHCGSKYPISAAKYCCECGAKRRGFGTMSFKTEVVSYTYS